MTLALGVLCLTIAAWPWWSVTALAIPGIVLTWIALPTRERFIHRPAPVNVNLTKPERR